MFVIFTLLSFLPVFPLIHSWALLLCFSKSGSLIEILSFFLISETQSALLYSQNLEKRVRIVISVSTSSSLSLDQLQSHRTKGWLCPAGLLSVTHFNKSDHPWSLPKSRKPNTGIALASYSQIPEKQMHLVDLFLCSSDLFRALTKFLLRSIQQQKSNFL